MVGTTTMTEHGSQAGEPAASDTTNSASEVTLSSGPGRGPSCLHLCPLPPSAEPQAFPDASSSILTRLLLRCSPKVQHWAPDPFSERMGRVAFEINRLRGHSLYSIVYK